MSTRPQRQARTHRPVADEVDRLRRFSRKLDPRDPQAPVPPPLPEGRVVLLPGRGETFCRIHDGGPDRPWLLLLHGWTATADLQWFTAYRTLAERWNFVAIDHRGHGRGLRTEEKFLLDHAADDAAALCEVLGIRSVVAVGYSMGGPIAMLTERRHPDLVDGMVLQATALEWRETMRERVTWRFLTLFERTLRSGRSRTLLERWLRLAAEDDPTLRPWMPWLSGEARRGDVDALIEAGRELSLYDARSFLAELRPVPSAVVVTTRDRLVRPRKQRQLASALRAPTFELQGDHDASMVLGPAFAAVTARAVESVLAQIAPAARQARSA